MLIVVWAALAVWAFLGICAVAGCIAAGRADRRQAELSVVHQLHTDSSLRIPSRCGQPRGAGRLQWLSIGRSCDLHKPVATRLQGK